MKGLIAFGTAAVVGYNAAAQELPDSINLSEEVGNILYQMGENGLAEIRNYGGLSLKLTDLATDSSETISTVKTTSISLNLNSIVDKDSSNLSRITLIDIQDNGVDTFDMLITEEKILIGNDTASITYFDGGLKGYPSMSRVKGFPGIEEFFTPKPGITKPDYNKNMRYLRNTLLKHQRKGKK